MRKCNKTISIQALFGYPAALALALVFADATVPQYLSAHETQPKVAVVPLGKSATGDVKVEEVLEGKTFSSDEGNDLTGTMTDRGQQNITPSMSNTSILQGYHDGTGVVFGDNDLSSSNIRAGVNIFGVSGNSNVVNTSSGNATSADIFLGKKAWVDGVELTGTGTFTSTSESLDPESEVVNAGTYQATTLSTVDSDLHTDNIKSGVTIFGITGNSNVVNTSSGDATGADLLSGKKAWVDGAEVTGSMSTQILDPDSEVVSPGKYNATTLSGVDSDLDSMNIKAGVTIFGFAGNSNVADTSSGDATSEEIAFGKKAWVDGVEITGTKYLPKTGSTISSTTGEDGDLQKGRTLPDPRFSSTANIVTDNLTGLEWNKNGNAFGVRQWSVAVSDCNSLSVDGKDDWRLANIRELMSLIDFGQGNPALPSTHPFTSIQNFEYWSSTTYVGDTDSAFLVNLEDGETHWIGKTETNYVLCCRGGN